MGFFKKKKTTTDAALVNGHTNGHAKYSSKSSSAAKTGVMASPTRPKPTLPETVLPKAPDPDADPVAYLRSIHAVRERSSLVLEKAKADQLKHFHVDMSKFSDAASYVVSIIKVCIICLPFVFGFRITRETGLQLRFVRGGGIFSWLQF
jgi:hypothetical protein